MYILISFFFLRYGPTVTIAIFVSALTTIPAVQAGLLVIT